MIIILPIVPISAMIGRMTPSSQLSSFTLSSCLSVSQSEMLAPVSLLASMSTGKRLAQVQEQVTLSAMMSHQEAGMARLPSTSFRVTFMSAGSVTHSNDALKYILKMNRKELKGKNINGIHQNSLEILETRHKTYDNKMWEKTSVVAIATHNWCHTISHNTKHSRQTDSDSAIHNSKSRNISLQLRDLLSFTIT